MKEKVENSEKKPKKRIINNRIIFFAFLSLFFGVILARPIYNGDLTTIIVTAIVAIFILLCLVLTRKFILSLVLVLVFFLGNGLFYLDYTNFCAKEYEDTCAVVGRVSDNISFSGSSCFVVIDNVSINGERADNINLSISNVTDKNFISCGDIISFEGYVNNVQLFKLGQFQNFYYRDNTPYSSSISVEKIVFAGRADVRYDESIRLRTRELLHQNMSDKNAELAYSVLFGDKSGLDGQTKTEYQYAGIIHILSVSGLHIGFLISLLYFLFKKFNKYVRAALVIVILILYDVLCGFTPSVMRASIMAAVFLLSKLIGKRYDSLTSLGTAGILIIIFKPMMALDAGFQMSFSCVLAIILLFDKICALISKVIPRRIAEQISLSICATIGTLPYVANFFQKLNFLSIFANMLIIPLFSVVFPILFLIFVLMLILPFMAFLLHIIDYAFVVITFIAQIFASTNLKINLTPFPVVINIALYLALVVISFVFMVSVKVKCALFAILVLFCGGFYLARELIPVDKNYMEYSSSGGCFVYVVNDRCESLLVTDSMDYDQFYEYAVLRGIKNVDYCICLGDGEVTLDNFSPKGIAYQHNYILNGVANEILGDEEINFGKFSFNFCYIGENMIGIEFSVNNFENFFASRQEFMYNESEVETFMRTGKFSFAFLNYQTLMYKYSAYSVALTRYANSFTPYSLGGFGNMRISFTDKNWTLSHID